MKRLLIVASAVVAVTLLGACSSGESSAVEKDRKTSATALRDLQRAHPTPRFRRSQLRQNLVEIVTAQAETTQTSSFFFNLGVADPVNSCPSIGFPIPATMQLTNPEAIVDGDNGRRATLPQVEPTGVYTGDTTGTYVICIDAQGSAYALYWEGFVQAVSGPAEWNVAKKQVVLVGPSSFDFSEGSE